MANITKIIQNGVAYTIKDEQAHTKIDNLAEKVNNPENQGGSNDYTDLLNKPKINGVELNGNKSLSDLGINSNGGGELDTSAFILPYVSPNLWNGEYKVGKLNVNTGEFDTTATTYYYAEIKIEPNTDYTIATAYRNWYVLYEDANFNYVYANYKRVETEEPVTFNSGNNTYIRFQCNANDVDNPAVANAWMSKRIFLIKGNEVPHKICEQVKHFVETDLANHSFYRSVASKLTDLTNPFKPTAVSMIGDSITAGYHSYNHAYIENCYAKLFGDYLLERFNNKIFNIPFFDENVEVYNTSGYKGLETGCSFGIHGGYAKIKFYGSYLAINTYNAQKPDTIMSVYIDNEETPYATYNFLENDSTKWETNELTEDYHTAKFAFSAGGTFGSIGIKKYVSFTNRAVSGINSTTVRTYFSNDRKFDNDDIIFCMIGTNDRSGGNVGLYDFNVRQVFKHGLEKMGKKVILMSATPSPRELYAVGEENSEASYNYSMKDVVAWVNIIGGKENEQTISFYNWLIDYAKEKQIPLGDFFNDGLHPTEECHALMFEHLLRECGFGVEMVTVN